MHKKTRIRGAVAVVVRGRWCTCEGRKDEIPDVRLQRRTRRERVEDLQQLEFSWGPSPPSPMAGIHSAGLRKRNVKAQCEVSGCCASRGFAGPLVRWFVGSLVLTCPLLSLDPLPWNYQLILSQLLGWQLTSCLSCRCRDFGFISPPAAYSMDGGPLKLRCICGH